jgi:hypothetical protein
MKHNVENEVTHEETIINDKLYSQQDLDLLLMKTDIKSIKERITDIVNLMREHDNKYVTKEEYSRDKASNDKQWKPWVDTFFRALSPVASALIIAIILTVSKQL